jgi:hypothetical protein
MFEPDFGSFAKHEVNILPAFFYLLCHVRSTATRPAMPSARDRRRRLNFLAANLASSAPATAQAEPAGSL